MDLATPTPDHKLLLQAVYEVFDPDGSWPVYQHLDARLDQDHGLAIDEVLATMPDGLLRVFTPIRPDTVVALRVAGLMHCDGAEDAVALFLHALKWCIAKERSFRPASQQLVLSSADASREWAEDGVSVEGATLATAAARLQSEQLYAGINSGADEWTITVPADIRRFRGVETIEDYLRIVASAQPQPVAANPLVDMPSGPRLLAPDLRLLTRAAAPRVGAAGPGKWCCVLVERVDGFSCFGRRGCQGCRWRSPRHSRRVSRARL